MKAGRAEPGRVRDEIGCCAGEKVGGWSGQKAKWRE